MTAHADDDARQLLDLIAENVGKLVGPVLNAKGKGIPELAAAGVPRTKAGKVVTPDGTDWSVSTLIKLARALKVEPWQLLLPDLQVSPKGTVSSVSAARLRQWPFNLVSKAEIEMLNPVQLERLEKSIRTRIEEITEDAADLENAGERQKRIGRN